MSDDGSNAKDNIFNVHVHNSEGSVKCRTNSGSSKNRDLSNARISFHSDDSFRPIKSGPPLIPSKPSCVPVLDFKSLSEFYDSEDEKLE